MIKMYNTKELNTMLLEAFPELKERFEDETSWDDGIDTGSYVVYEDIFMPYVVQAFVDNDQESINRVMQFVEKLADAIIWMIQHPEMRSKMATKAIENVQRFSIEKIAEKWRSLFDAL